MDLDTQGGSPVRVFTRKFLFDRMQEQNTLDCNTKLDQVEHFLLTSDNFSEAQVKEIKHKFSHFKSEFKKRWTSSSYKIDKFLTKNKDWLQGTLEIPKCVIHPGRPTKAFEDSSERTKRRKTEQLRELDIETLTFATQVKLNCSGKKDAAKVLKDISTSPTRATKYKKAYEVNKLDKDSSVSVHEALVMFVEADLSRRQYDIIRSSSKKLFPCYSLIQRAKGECYPDKNSYNVSETCAEVKLDSLLDHTVKRLIQFLGTDVLQSLTNFEKENLSLICKWGCDGAQQTHFKQKFESQSDSDTNIFQSSLVPIRLVCEANGKLIWENPTPSSPRFCRPIRIRFVKETADITNDEIKYVEESIKALPEVITVQVCDEVCLVKTKMLLTMVDAKVCNAATQTTSTARCYICNETSKDFNKMQEEKVVDPDTLSFGLSILHARIRVFENLLHLAYKLPVKKWRIEKKHQEEVGLVNQTKRKIQDEFKAKLGLLVDVPKPGFGNTNDGNTSRRFFSDVDIASEITGINKDLIYRLKVILEVISSGHTIDHSKLALYARDTAKLYIRLYPWYPMSPTLHKLLVHSATIVKHAIVPIGQLSEEAAEARNKHFKLYRLNHARMFSRKANNMDVLNRLLLTSDPLLSGSRPRRSKRSKPFLKETLEMLLPAQPSASSILSSEMSEDQMMFSSSDEDF